MRKVQSKYTFCIYTKQPEDDKCLKKTSIIRRTCWRPYLISRLATTYANLCRRFQKLQALTCILLFGTSCCTGVRVTFLLIVTLPKGLFVQILREITVDLCTEIKSITVGHGNKKCIKEQFFIHALLEYYTLFYRDITDVKP